ncbi:iron chaperone [Actinotalea fermentans]|uniref:Uncharacterized protein n=1 Tax=Actinotalea fermentans TaxID=43671 RepID=A0A511YUW7_9CELL|nr:DUF1801 domain-containing protein [Actinotalea fermentans]KGM17947.1 hypothetical protein N867_00410 [Actinotalea fermentans ATCC 43279 = JCM 9966 = DSM 3133]GEN78956.1 hypothetical protein AFE02nite_06900 [Actinotalea fermentans]
MARTTTDPAAGERGGDTFTEEERAAMKERARELKKARSGNKVDAEQEVLAKIAELPEADRVVAERIHAIIREAAPELEPRTWYGMPAYGKAGKATVFFQPAAKFKARYSTLGFNDDAPLDDGAMWPTAFALTTLGPAEEARIVELVRRAAG